MSFDIQFVDSIGEAVFDPITDNFSRTVSNGWGTATTGQAWTTSGGAAADYSVNGIQGLHSVGAVNSTRRTLLAVSLTDPEASIQVKTQAGVFPLGARFEAGILLRYIDANNYYAGHLFFNPGGSMSVRLLKRVAGVATTLVETVVAGLTHSSDVFYSLKFRLVGSQLRARAWQSTLAEPSVWHATAIDPSLTAAGQLAVESLLATGNTNTLPVVLPYDSFSMIPNVQIRLNLNSTPWSTQLGTRFDPPPMRYAVASTLLTDGEHIPAAAYGDRTLALRLRLLDVTEDQAAAQLQALFRELNRPTNFLRYRPGTSNPVWFRTKRCSADEVDFDPIERTVSVDVPAEPFAYGLKETLAVETVNNDPAAATNGMFFDITGVKGDVETPLTFEVATAALDSSTIRSAVAVRRRGNPAQFFRQAESFIAGTDTSVQANDPVMSGTGSNYMRTTFATTTSMVARLTLSPLFSSPVPENRGTYRMFLRYRGSVAGGVINVRVVYGNTFVQFATDPVGLAVTTDLRYVDLGLLTLPIGIDPVHDGYSGVEIAVKGPFFSLQAERVSGTGVLDWDVVLFVPADDRYALIGWSSPDGAGNSWVVDGVAGGGWHRSTADGAVAPSGALPIAGDLPLLSPGVTNRVYFVGNAGSTNTSDSLTLAYTVTPYYWPRYISVRPPST